MNRNEYLSVSKNIKKVDLLRKFEKSGFTEAYFVDDRGKLLGKAKVNSVLFAKSKGLIEDGKPLFLLEDSNISDAILKISNFVGESVPVVNSKGLLKGVITEADLFQQYIQVQEEISHIEKD